MIKTNINVQNKNKQLWSEELIKFLAQGKNNYQVGEKLILKTDKFSVWTTHLPAGKTLPFHTHHHPYFWTSLSAGKSRSYYDDGNIVETEYQKGDIKYFPDLNENNYFTHNLENIGTTTLIFTVVVFFNK